MCVCVCGQEFYSSKRARIKSGLAYTRHLLITYDDVIIITVCYLYTCTYLATYIVMLKIRLLQTVRYNSATTTGYHDRP